MARLPRLYAPGVVQYLVQRATVDRTLFADADDYQGFLSLCADAARRHGFAIHAYALSAREVHLLGTPTGPASSGALLQAVGRVFVPAVNRRTGRTGPLWERRYRSTLVDDALVLAAMRHVETQTAEAWSSRHHHLGTRQDPAIVDHGNYWALSDTPFGRQAAYGRWLDDAVDPAFERRLGDAVQRGWAVGSPAFLAGLDENANRRSTPLQRGRPRKIPAIVSPNKSQISEAADEIGYDPK